MSAGSVFELRRRDVAVVCLVGVGQAIALVAFLLLVRAVVDRAALRVQAEAPGASSNDLRLQLAALVGVVLLYGVLRAVEFSRTERAGYEVVRRLRMRMYAHLQGMGPRQIQHRSRGALLLRFTGDLSMLRTWVSRGLLGGLVALIVLACALTVLAVLNLAMALAVALVVAAGAIASVASGATVRRATRVMRRRRSLLTSNMDEQISALAVIQVFGRAGGEASRLSRQNDALTSSLIRVAKLRGRLRGISSATGLLAAVAVLGVGVVELEAGRASLGLVVATVAVARQLHAPVRTLGLAHDYWQRQRVSQDKIRDFLSSSSTALAGPELSPARVRRGRIELVDLTVLGSLTGVTVTAEPGQIIGICGPAGAGKSSLLAAVARLITPTAGHVALDGHVVARSTASSVARAVGMVSPDLPLMRGTVRRNITYRRPEVSVEELERVLAAAGVNATLAALPQGLDTWLTEEGRNVSAGQRQHIALARALVDNPAVLLLDEPTSQLDEQVRSLVHEVVLRHQGTVLMASHDPAELSLADRVWVLRDGRLVEDLPGEEYRDRLWRGNRVHGAAGLPR